MDERQRVIVFQNALGHAVNVLAHNLHAIDAYRRSMNEDTELRKISSEDLLSVATVIADGALEYAYGEDE